MSKTAKEVADDLDGAAHANLSSRGVQRFMKYKERLLAEGTNASDIEDILRGFIWDEAEGEANEDQEPNP